MLLLLFITTIFPYTPFEHFPRFSGNCENPYEHWSTWTEWSKCSKTCGKGGVQVKHRVCKKKPCSGNRYREIKTCDLRECNAEINCPRFTDFVECVNSERTQCGHQGKNSLFTKSNKCEPGCVCKTRGVVFDKTRNTCVTRKNCNCINPVNGRFVNPGAVVKSSCNVCVCKVGGRLECTNRDCGGFGGDGNDGNDGNGGNGDNGGNVGNDENGRNSKEKVPDWCPWSSWTREFFNKPCQRSRECGCPGLKPGNRFGLGKCENGGFGNPFSKNPYSNNPYSNNPYSNNPYSNNPYSNNPYSSDQNPNNNSPTSGLNPTQQETKSTCKIDPNTWSPWSLCTCDTPIKIRRKNITEIETQFCEPCSKGCPAGTVPENRCQSNCKNECCTDFCENTCRKRCVCPFGSKLSRDGRTCVKQGRCPCMGKDGRFGGGGDNAGFGKNGENSGVNDFNVDKCLNCRCDPNSGHLNCEKTPNCDLDSENTKFDPNYDENGNFIGKYDDRFYTNWGSWSPCSVTCTSKYSQNPNRHQNNIPVIKTRFRKCKHQRTYNSNNRSPNRNLNQNPNQHSNQLTRTLTNCDAKALAQMQACDTRNMPECVENVSLWSSWSVCSVSCGFGVKIRDRLCFHKNCENLQLDQIQQCGGNNKRCENEWSVWSSWSMCSSTCRNVDGMKYRRKVCKTGVCETGVGNERQNGENGVLVDYQKCAAGLNADICDLDGRNGGDGGNGGRDRDGGNNGNGEINGNGGNNENGGNTGNDGNNGNGNKNETKPTWSTWSPWSKCSKTCNSGRKQRFRDCPTSNRKMSCAGQTNQLSTCNNQPCSTVRQFQVQIFYFIFQ